jgi:diguanylate cyclase (GGDEF)-like protein
MIRANDWLRLRLIGLVVCILLAGFAATNLISYRNASQILKATVLHRELPLTGNNIYSEIQADLIRPVFISSVMANDTFVRDWLLAGEHDREQVTRYLETIHEKYGVFTSFLISDRTHEYYHFHTARRPVDPNNAEDIWYFRAREMKTPYEINIDYDLASNRTLTIFVNYRVVDYQGNFLGVTGVGLNIDSVQRIVQRYRNDFQRSVYFVAKSGDVTLTSSGGPPAGGNIKTLTGLRAIGAQILAAPEGQYEYARNGETFLLDARFIPELGWYAVVEQRQSDVLSGLWNGVLTNLWIGCGIIVLTAAIIAVTISQYHRKLEQATTTDRLTGLTSPPLFEATLQRLLTSRRAADARFCLLLLDIDHFNHVIETLGHTRVDGTIRAIAHQVRSMVRDTDMACRWGGGELIILTTDCAADEARVRAETLRVAIARTPVVDPDDGSRVTVSIGVAARSPGDTADALLGRVHEAVRQAKRDGRNCVRVARPVADAPCQTAARPVAVA